MAKISHSVKRKITDFCSPYELIQIGFVNQMGGYDFWYFNKDSKRTVQVDRNEFTKVLSPTYAIGDRGRTVYSVVVKDQWKINSDWVLEYDYAFLEELIDTTEAYWIMEDGPHPIIITNKSYEIKTSLRDRLFNIQLEFEMAYDKNIITQ